MRGLWVSRWSLSSPTAIQNIVRTAVRCGINSLFVQVRGRADAWYPSALEPRAEALADAPKSFDPLQTVIAEARRNDLQVHAWMNSLIAWTGSRPPKAPNHIVNAHPDWLQRDRSGRNSAAQTEQVEGLFLQPSHPEVRAHLKRVYADVATRYDLDGIHLDYIRYPCAEYDFSRQAVGQFNRWRLGRPVSMASQVPSRSTSQAEQWQAWRRGQVTSLVQEIAAEVRKARPGIGVTAAVFANIEDACLERGQDWPVWLREGLIDAACPMAYSRDTRTVEKLIRTAVAAVPDAAIFAGIGSYRITPEQTVEKIASARRAGANGVVLFSYSEMSRNGTSTAYLEQVRRGAFASRAAAPRTGFRR